MDIHDLIAEFAALPGQVPDVEETESRATRIVRSVLFDHPEMVALYRAQGLPVDRIEAEDVYVLDPEGGPGDGPQGASKGPAVLFEVGVGAAPGGLVTAVAGDRVLVDLGAGGSTDPGRVLEVEVVRLRTAGVLTHRYVLPASFGRLSFLAPPEVFAVRATLLAREGGVARPLIFGPRVALARAKY